MVFSIVCAFHNEQYVSVLERVIHAVTYAGCIVYEVNELFKRGVGVFIIKVDVEVPVSVLVDHVYAESRYHAVGRNGAYLV